MPHHIRKKTPQDHRGGIENTIKISPKVARARFLESDSLFGFITQGYFQALVAATAFKFKGCLWYKTTASQNVSSEAQVKNFLIS